MKVGDLVVVVKPTICCGNAKRIGTIFKITEFEVSLNRCLHCRNEIKMRSVLGFEDDGFEPSRLRVIPPLNELEAEKAVEHA